MKRRDRKHKSGLRVFLYCVFCMAIFQPLLLTSLASRQAAPQEDAESYFGFYLILGGRPKGFEKFENFLIRSTRGQIVSGGVVASETEMVYEFASVRLIRDRLTFTSKRIKGGNYSFEGRFLKSPPFPYDEEKAVVEGSLKKYRN